MFSHILQTTVKTVCKRQSVVSSALPWSRVLPCPAFRLMSSLSQQFEDAKNRLGTLKEEPADDVKLKLYALFKQSTVGQCATKRPGVMDFVGRAKWDAWNGLGAITKDEAQQEYVKVIESLAGSQPAISSTPAAPGAYETLIVTKEAGVGLITLNRPAKKNAITIQMYEEWQKAFEELANDDSVTIAATTGSGEYYCSGNDLGNFNEWLSKAGSPQEMAKNAADFLERYVSSFIDFPKPLIGLVNGPAVGIPITVLGMYDAVYCTDKATFYTPFSALGQSPEACSTFTFPRIMGTSKASEMLLFNRRINAHEACAQGLVSKVIPDQAFRAETQRLLQEYAQFPVKSLVYSKKLIRDIDRQTLHEVNKAECARLAERWVSKDCRDALQKFFSRKG